VAKITPEDNGYQTKRERLEKRVSSLETERSSWDTTNRDIAEYLLPGSDRFLLSDTNRGERKEQHILDDAGGESLSTLSAGLMSGMTSPARPWFEIKLRDSDANKRQDVKEWTYDVTQIVQDILNESNTYQVLPLVYEDMGAFGGACDLLLPDQTGETVLHHTPIAIGSYCLAQDFKGRVNVMTRKLWMTVDQVVRQFGLENVVRRTKDAYDRGNYDQWIEVCHVVEPRRVRDAQSGTNRNMPFLSCYFERGVEDEKVLRESGFTHFPVLAPRWTVRGGNVYGTGPGRKALGAIRQLQSEQWAKSTGIHHKVEPALALPSSCKGQEVDANPGGRTFYDAMSPHGTIRPLFESGIDLQPLLEDIQDVRARIQRAFSADLFRMMSLVSDTTQRTAAEIAKRNEEQLVQLGPVYTRATDELLRPLIERAFEYANAAGRLPPPPDDLIGQDLVINFVSVLAQAQKMIGTSAMDRYVGSLQVVAQFKPDVLDKFDEDEWAEEYADRIGVPPRLVKSNEQVAEIRQARAKAQLAQQQSAMMAEQAKMQKDLASAQTSEPSALTDVMGGLQGYNYPTTNQA